MLLIDKGDKLGRKLGISGGGRCNVTNNKELDELIKHIPGNGRFLAQCFSYFQQSGYYSVFRESRHRLKEEDNGRMFPVTDKAKTVVDALVNQIKRQGVEMRTNSPVKEILYGEGHVYWSCPPDRGNDFMRQACIVAVGGKSVPQTGSTGDGYAWAEKAGHTITELFPTEVPLTSNEPFIQSKELQGLSLRDVFVIRLESKGEENHRASGGYAVHAFRHFRSYRAGAAANSS